MRELRQLLLHHDAHGCPSGDRRDDADRVAGRDRRLLLLQVADIFVVQIDVDEAAQLALLVEQMVLQPGVLLRQIGEQLAHRRAVSLDRVLLIRVRPERCWNQNFRRHANRPLRSLIDLPSRYQTVISRAVPAATATMMYANVGQA